MKITEWYARAVAAGLIPECYKNISARWYQFVQQYAIQNDDDLTQYIILPNNIQQDIFTFKPIQLRKDGKNLYELEWREPTKQDVGRMCWFNQSYCGRFELLYQKIYEDSDISSGLLADHGQIAPTEADFLKVYRG